MTETTRKVPDMDPRVVASAHRGADAFMEVMDTSKGVDPHVFAAAIAAVMGSDGWIRKRQAAVEHDEIDPEAVKARCGPVVQVEAASVTDNLKPEQEGTST